MVRLVKPIVALRIFTLSSTVLLIGAVFTPRASFATGFLVGAAIGLGIGAQSMVWNSSLQWRDKEDRGETIQMNLARPER